ncbi:MAG: histidine phosphatase family protein, partial [Clostridiales bacterium]|nr:histidine phosphatase family protein [Clostridiales bacterium]
MGRAKDTASCTLQKNGMQATECQWLQEFNAPKIWRPDVQDRKMISWDWLPGDWMKEEQYFQYEQWMNTDIMQEGKVGEEYQKIVDTFDELLSSQGYRREGHYYRAEQASNDT